MYVCSYVVYVSYLIYVCMCVCVFVLLGSTSAGFAFCVTHIFDNIVTNHRDPNKFFVKVLGHHVGSHIIYFECYIH